MVQEPVCRWHHATFYPGCGSCACLEVMGVKFWVGASVSDLMDPLWRGPLGQILVAETLDTCCAENTNYIKHGIGAALWCCSGLTSDKSALLQRLMNVHTNTNGRWVTALGRRVRQACRKAAKDRQRRQQLLRGREHRRGQD